jgi:membrane-associated phospholipid phosphatase
MSEGKLLSTGKNIITSSPYSIYTTGILAWIITGNPQYGFFSLLAIIMGDGFNAIEKQIAKKIMGKNSTLGARPSGCGGPKNTNCTGCGIYPVTNGHSHTWGMPSGHAQITSFAASYWTIYIWMKYKHEINPTEKKKLKQHAIISTIVMWSLALLVWTQRIYSKCHTIFQIVIGMIIGSLLGIFGYYISTLVFKDLPKINITVNS